MPRYKNMFSVDLANGQARQVNIGTIYQGDSYANRIGAIVTENGLPVSLGGTCHGKIIQTIDGATVLIENGVVDGNRVYCDLTSECYDSEGPVEIHIKWTNGSETAELLFASGYLKKTETDEIVDPSGRITISVETLINDIAEAEASIPEDYSILSNHVDALTHIDLTDSGYINGSGAEVANPDYRRTGYIPISSDSLLVLEGFFVGSTSGSAYAYYFYNADKTPISGANSITTKTVVTTIPSTAAFVRFSSRISQGETPIAYVSNHVVEMVADLAPRMDAAEPDIAGLKSALLYAANDTSLFENGGINASSGMNTATNADKRLRTKTYLYAGIKRVEASAGYKYALFAYDASGVYQGAWNGTELIATSTTWLAGKTWLSAIGDYKYRIVAAKADNGAVSPSDAANLLLYAATDQTLSKPGVPADAKAAGEFNAYITGDEITASLTWTNNSSINLVTGGTEYNNNQQTSQLVDVSDVSAVRFQALNTPEGGARACCAFYRADETFIEPVARISNSTGYAFIERIVPSDAKYARFAKLINEPDVPFRAFVQKKTALEPNTQIMANKAEIDEINASDLKPICYKESGQVYMFIPTANKKYYIQYTFSHTQNAETNANGWRLTYCYLCNPNKTHIKYITYTGEWEMAVKASGWSDFIGLGNHGDEIETLFKLYVDGDEITEDAVFADRTFETVQLINQLTMYSPADHETVVGYHTRIDTVNALKKTVTIENKVDFAADLTLSAGYLFMASLSRYHDNVQITDHFMDNQDYILTDCGTTTFDPSNANHGAGEVKHGASEYKFWGSGLDLYGHARILRRIAPNGNTLSTNVSNDEVYNKIYFSMCAAGETVSGGDTWIMETEFFMDSGYNPAS